MCVLTTPLKQGSLRDCVIIMGWDSQNQNDGGNFSMIRKRKGNVSAVGFLERCLMCMVRRVLGLLLWVFGTGAGHTVDLNLDTLLLVPSNMVVYFSVMLAITSFTPRRILQSTRFGSNVESESYGRTTSEH